jgi:uncharacterized spore protein YtfJ
MSLQEILGTITDRVTAAANVKTVYGDPVVVGGRTVIPAASIRYGFGAGSGAKGNTETQSAGGGGGVRATPCGALEITPEGTRFIPFVPAMAVGLAFAAGIVAGVAAVALARPKRVEIVKR